MGGACTQRPVWESPKSCMHSARVSLVLAAECPSQVPTPVPLGARTLFPPVSSELRGLRTDVERGAPGRGVGMRWCSCSARLQVDPDSPSVQAVGLGTAASPACCAGLSDCLGGGGEGATHPVCVPFTGSLALRLPSESLWKTSPRGTSRGHRWPAGLPGSCRGKSWSRKLLA